MCASLLARKFRVPAVVFYIVSGLLLGRYIPWINTHTNGLQAASDIGVALLLFTIELNCRLRAFFQRKEVLALGFLQFVGITFAVYSFIATAQNSSRCAF